MIRYSPRRARLSLSSSFWCCARSSKGFFGRPKTAVRPYQGPPPPPPSGPVAELKKDPVCGAYVSTACSVSRSIKGQLIYFCSDECRDKYVA